MASTGLTLGKSAAPARVAAAVTIVLSFLGAAGWIFSEKTLTSVIPGAAQMKINTAVCVLLCGGALWILTYRTGPSLEGLARAMAALAAAIGAATLGEYLFEWQLGIDELLLTDTSGVFSVFHGRMSPYSAAAFIILGFAVGGLRLRWLDRAAQIAAGLGLAIGLVALLGYCWHARDLTTDRWLPPIAINTAACFIAIAAGVLFAGGGSIGRQQIPRIALSGVEFRILSGFTVAILLLVLGGSFTYRTGEQLAASMEWIAHTQEVRTTLANLFGSLAGAHVAVRDYLATGELSRLEEYQRLVAAERANLANLPALVADNPSQHADAVRVGKLVEQELDVLDQTLIAFRTYGLAAAQEVLTRARGANTISHIGAATKEMDDVEKQLMRRREADAAKVRLTTLTSLLLTMAAAIGLFIAFFRGIHNEMLARRAAEQALRDSDQYNRGIIESSPDCVSVLNTGGHVMQMTAQGLKLMDFDDFAAVSSQDWCSLWSTADRDAARNAVAAARSGAAGHFSSSTTQRDGGQRWWDIIVKPIVTSRGEPQRLLAVARDISDVKRSESDLLAANRFLDSLIESLPVMVVVTDARTSRFVRVNRMCEQMFGLSAGQMIGKTVFDLLQPEEAELTRKTDQEVLETGKLVDIAERTIATGSGVKVFNTKKVAIYDERGAAQYVLAISTDITASKLSEQAIRELNSQLEAKAEQLQSTNKELESFSYSVSHDLRAPLRAIDGFAEIIQEDYAGKLDEEAVRYLTIIRENSMRMGLLIDDLLEFSRLGRQTVTKVEINVDLLVREVLDEVLHGEAQRATGKPEPRIEVGPLPEIWGDRNLLRQVWMNLIANAVKYSSKSAQPHIQIGGSAGEAENEYFVRDNGVGFNMAYVEKLFGVFQRLHRADEFTGTGVGLAIVQRVVKRHGGRVWAQGKVDEGAVFSFALPRGL
jgi:PAS domain S-box-containing protein